MSVDDRFWAKVWAAPGPLDTSCWLFTGGADDLGYGRFWDGAKTVLAHRYGYGAVANDPDLDHLCRAPSCIRKSHLEPVTHRENLLRGTGIAPKNAAKTHCPKGHEYTPENTRVSYYRYKASGRRQPTRHCRECGRAYERSKGKAA